uniref:SH3 domain-containing protein n=1 Tax=Strigamia maritima TaxID=126957 RepID=T1IMK5_STRMM
MLVAKEQRLKFLKQQELRHHQMATENERLRRLREKVEAQELKLRKLRALRGQVDQQKANNNSLSSELESIRALFNEKEKELSLAVAKVDELTRQLEELRRGRLANGNTANVPSHADLEKLRRELMYRNKLNEAQSAQLAQQREALSRGQEEMQRVDRRIAELQQRLHRKRLLNHQLSNQINSAASAKQTLHPPVALVAAPLARTRPRPLSANIAAVEPFKHTPKDPPSEKTPNSVPVPVPGSGSGSANTTTQDDLHPKLSASKGGDELAEFHASKGDPKYQTLPINTRFSTKPGKQGEEVSLDVPNEEKGPHAVVHSIPAYTPPKGVATTPLAGQQWATAAGKVSNLTPKPYGVVGSGSGSGVAHSSLIPSRVPSTTVTSMAVAPKYVPPPPPVGNVAFRGLPHTPLTAPNTPQKPTSHSSPRPSPIYQTSSTRIAPVTPHTLSATPQGFLKEVEDDPIVTSAVAKISTLPSCQILTDINSPTDPEQSKPILPPKPTPPTKPTPPPRQIHSDRTKVDTSPDAVDSALSILRGTTQSPTKGPNKAPNVFRYGAVRNLMGNGATFLRNVRTDAEPHSDGSSLDSQHGSGDDVDNVKRSELPIKAKPLTIKKNSGVDPPKLKILPSNGATPVPYPRKASPPLENSGSEEKMMAPNVHVSMNRRIEMPPAFLFPENEAPPTDLNLCLVDGGESKTDIPDLAQCVKVDVSKVRLASDAGPKDCFGDNVTVIHIMDSSEQATDVNEEASEENNKKKVDVLHVNVAETIEICEESPLASSPEGSNDSQPLTISRLSNSKAYKGNLKSKEKTRIARRVSFDPLALLLDASLEGELELVKKTAREVPNPSAANDEGITALHNAICAGHYEIIKFLVEYGCDVNAQDSDGWTPLHCAASCNNLPMVKFLVEHGACIFATTLSDHETAAEKCEEDEEGFDGCSEYLYSIQEKLGILNNGEVFALYDYEAQNADELGFVDRDMLVALRKGDEFEREWWWSRLENKEGYIPRNLLGLYPRVIPNRDRDNP